MMEYPDQSKNIRKHQPSRIISRDCNDAWYHLHSG